MPRAISGLVSAKSLSVNIERLSHEGRGVGRVDGKIVFVEGALPGETVRAKILKRRARYDEARALEIHDPHPDRVAPRCAHATICGGCSLQHLAHPQQVEHKQAVLTELLLHHAHITPDRWLAPLLGPIWAYRRKARLGAKFVPKKGGVLVGFRERASPYIAELERCEILVEKIGGAVLALRDLIGSLSIADRVPQLEVACDDARNALIVRHLDPLNAQDLDYLGAFSAATGIEFYLQPGGPDTVVALTATSATLSYALADLEFAFAPADFTQVNADINRELVALALQLLEIDQQDKVLDLFCGLGNFSLPFARRAKSVIGIESEKSLLARARANALANRCDNAKFVAADLFTEQGLALIPRGDYRRILLDPPRSGAELLVRDFNFSNTERLLYVSCNPVTLARDTAQLLARGFRLHAAGIADMFPHTAHVESIALFAR